MKSQYVYNQFKKNLVRHTVLLYAIELLTTNREQSACVPRNHVRKIYDYYVISEDESNSKREANKINLNHLKSWEKLHDSNIGKRHPEDLTICYLCGPEPQNDFKEIVSLGVLPQNIWAFETDKATYDKAIKSFEKGHIPQPHILKQNIETFFSNTPKKFDIIYIDACGSIASEQHALRCITTACLYHRLSSPGIIISNFSEPEDKDSFRLMMKDYLFSKTEFGASCKYDDWTLKREDDNNFYNMYSEFISYVLRDIPGIIVPLQRLWKNPYLEQIIDKNLINDVLLDKTFFDEIKYNSIAKYFIYGEISKTNDERRRKFNKELINYSDFINGLKTILLLRLNNANILKDDIKNIKNSFEMAKTYQFLDKPHSNLLFDVIINQLAYPLHCNTSLCRRYRYKAKTTYMFTDVMVYDECRYIYDWLPSIHQLETAYNNVSWQYIFRFALDGLVKSREKYNNEFFFQGSVISDTKKEFLAKEIAKRIDL